MTEAKKAKIKKSVKQFIGSLFGGDASFEVLRAMNRQKLLIIYYHRVLKPEDARKFRIPDMCTDIETFKEHIRFLSKHYTPVSEQDIILALEAKGALPDFPVWVTFDDGYRDNFIHAYPVLKEFKVPATFFISTGLINHSPKALVDLKTTLGIDTEKAQNLFMSWEQIRELSDQGFFIGGHTRSHRILTTLEGGQIEEEIVQCKQEIEKRIGRPIYSFAYPHGKRLDYPAEVCAPLLKKYGFKLAVSTIGGHNGPVSLQNQYELRRVGIAFEEPFTFFKLKIGLGSSWQK